MRKVQWVSDWSCFAFQDMIALSWTRHFLQKEVLTSTGKQEKTFLCKYLEGVNRLLLSTLSSNELLVPASTCMYSNNFIGVSYQWYQRWKWAVKPPPQCRICRIQAESQIRSSLFPDLQRCSSFSKWLTKRSWTALLMMAFCARSSSPSKSASGASFSQLCSPERGGEKMGARQSKTYIR